MHRAVTMSMLFGFVAGLPSTGLARAGRWDRDSVYGPRVAALKL
jgi:hypothetical protein